MAAAVAVTMLATGCNYSEKDDILVSRRSNEALERQQIEEENNKDYTIWEFVHGVSAVYYLWNDNVPLDINYSNYETPQDLFESFRHRDDRFSAVINNYTEADESLDNIYESDGINYGLYLEKQGSDNVVATVEYVYDGTPAKEAGIKRGYVIRKVNGTQLTTSNYNELLNQKTCTYTYSTISVKEQHGETITEYGDELHESPAITKRHLTIDPILKTSVIVKDGRRIGYFLYDSFTLDTKGVIDAIERLEAQQIEDLVLDLRINTGGYINTLDTLAAMLVPDGHEGDLFMTETYNQALAAELRQESNAPNFNKRFFASGLPNLHLNRIFILTSNNTASASEQLISGLMPYMPVTLIGDRTYGKFTGNFLLNDVAHEGSDPDGIPYSEWAVYLCVMQCNNANGEMKFKNGFTPDYAIPDIYRHELGDEQEPLFAKALELCTGSLAKSAKTYRTPFQDYIGHYGKPSIKYSFIVNR